MNNSAYQCFFVSSLLSVNLKSNFKQMKIYKIAVLPVLITFLAACNQSSNKTSGHTHAHDNITVPYVAYNEDIEVFIDAEPMANGHTSTLNVHMTSLHDFKPISPERIEAFLIVNDSGLKQVRDRGEQDGLYQFMFQPTSSGNAYLEFAFEWQSKNHLIRVENIEIYKDAHDAIHLAEKLVPQSTSAISFLKDQSWKVDFKTAHPQQMPFGKVIKSTATVFSSPVDKVVVSAKTSGFVKFAEGVVSIGKAYKKNEQVFTVHGDGITANNAEVILKNAKVELELAEAEYERDKLLANNQIVSNKEYIESKARYQKALTELKNLQKTIGKNGEKIVAPINGYIEEVLVNNGEYVEAGQAVFGMVTNRRLILNAFISQSHLRDLNKVNGLNVEFDDEVLSLDQLKGKVLSVGKSMSTTNHLLPISFEIDYHDGLISGGFVNVYILTKGEESLVVPEKALCEEQGVYFVYVQLTPELFEKRLVKIGSGDGVNRAVISGLSKDDRIVTEGAILVKLAAVSNTIDPHAGHVH